MSASEPAEDLRCAAWSRAIHLDPVGTAGSYAGFLVVDWPLPWPADVKEIGALDEVRRTAEAAGFRVQLTIPDDGPAGARVALYDDRPRQRVSAPADVVGAAMALLGGDDGDPVPSHEVLVCTHGRRDRCCGSWGTALAAGLTGRPSGRDAEVRRTSHTGGHRFAPTVIVLPEATMWAFADAALVDHVVARDVPIADALPRYRGCALLPSAEAQVLERAALADVGWELLDRPRVATHIADDRYRLQAGDDTWEATVVATSGVTLPECGVLLDPPTGKAQQLYDLRDLSSTSGGHTSR